MRFSIVIPNYNSEKWIEKCLTSVLNQTFQDFEIIVVDDMSTDNSVSIIKSLLRPQDKFIVNKSKRLNGGTRNVGIVEAQGEYTLHIDCDDWLKDNNVLQKINDKLNGEDVLFLGYEYHTKNSNTPKILRYDNLEQAFEDIVCAIWTKCVRTKLLKRCLFPEGTLFEDRTPHYELLLACETFNCLGETTHVWNRENNSTISCNPAYITYRFEYCGELYRLLKNKVYDPKLKQFILKELKGYLNSCNEMVGEL